MRKQLLMITAAVVLGGVLFNAPAVRAQFAVSDVSTQTLISLLQGAVTSVISTIGSNITSAVTGFQTSLNGIMTQGFTQTANYAKASVGAQQQIANANNMVNARVQRDFRNAQIRDEHTANPQFCNAADHSQAQIASSVASHNVAQAIQEVSDNRGEGNAGTPAFFGQGQAVQAINNLHYARYCSPVEADAGLCVTSTRANADQRARNLFGTGTYPGQEGVNAANDFKTNLIQPIVPAVIRADQLASVTGQDAAARRRSYNARMSLANGVMAYTIAVQTPSVPLTAQQKAQLVAERLPPQETGSWLTAVSLEVNRRMSDGGWHASLQAMPPASVQREIATQLALTNYLAMQNYRVGLYQVSLAATQIAQTEESRLRDPVQMPSPDLVSR
ncbi:MAG: hypothetical protein H7Z10_03380 [Gemmatimonadaceae bacterium]|nr:hypothetical protein [Acetobacteraceae bacterium]